MAVSDAVAFDRISRIVGYKLVKGVDDQDTPNLPQSIAILGEANTANQGSLDTNGKQITSAQEAGELYGFGSPIHQIARILRPSSGVGVGSIPTVVYPQAEVGVASERNIVISGTATENVTHSVVINGRNNVDGISYDFSVLVGDTNVEIHAKIIDAVNNVLGAPVIATADVNSVDLLTKWAGLTSEELNVIVDNNGNGAGITYVITSTATGTTTPDIQPALDQFGSTWHTLLINPYGAVKIANLEAFKGVPDPTTPTGRYAGIIFKPFIALFGSIEDDKDNLVAITDVAARKTQVTNALCPAPNSSGWTWEAAANMTSILGPILRDNPHLDVAGKFYPDMPVPTDQNIGDMNDYENRDFLVKKGSSTVDLVSGNYQVQDFITTYHPDGELPPQFRYVRNLMIDFNIRFAYFLLEQINVVDHSIAENDQPVKVPNTIKPKQWIQIINDLADRLAERNIIVEVAFTQDSIIVETSETNPDRLETFFRYKRSPFVRIASTNGEANFAFGLNG